MMDPSRARPARLIHLSLFDRRSTAVRLRHALLTTWLLTWLAGCGAPPLHRAQETTDRLAQTVLDAFAGRDEAALRALALDEREFREQVWPELAASRAERNLPFGYVWTDLRTKSDASLAGLFEEFGGRSYELERVMFTGGTTQYGTFLVHRKAALLVREGDGTRHVIRLFGSVIEKGRRFKVFSFVVD